jgi:hypothetical protein
MCAKLRECGIRVNLTVVVAILRLPPTRAFSQGELASTASPLLEKSDNESTSTSESGAGGASRDSWLLLEALRRQGYWLSLR